MCADVAAIDPSSHSPQHSRHGEPPLPEGEAFHQDPTLQFLPMDRSRALTPRGSSRLNNNNNNNDNDNDNDMARSRSRPNIITPEEYESLPPSIQKKYFSSVERLRIAQQSAAQKRKKQQRSPPEARCSPKPSIDSIRPKTAHSFKSSSVASYTPRSNYSRQVRTDADVNEEQALRFLALPEEVKRSNFTPEELVLLTESSKRALGTLVSISDDDFERRMTLDRKRSFASSLCYSSHSGILGDDIEKDVQIQVETTSPMGFEDFGEKEIESLKKRVQRREGSMSSTQSALPHTWDRPRQEHNPKPLSRKLSRALAPLPLPPPTLRPLVSSPSLKTYSGHFAHGMQQVPEGETVASIKYYKDSEARQKVREYLSSPEKFEEALEFGFPSRRSIIQRSISTASSSPALQSDCDGPSPLNSKDDEDGESSVPSPRTPSVGNDSFDPSIMNHASLDSAVALPYSSIKPGPRSLSPDIYGREMTLRMTLTRPELRAPEQELYAFQRQQVSGVDVETSDPLALETLPFCDDHTGAHGAFAVPKQLPKGFMRAFKNFRIR